MKRYKHNLGNYRLFTGDMGRLYPVGLQEVLPGDTFQHSTSLLVRLSPMSAPIMHPIEVRLHHFFVPNRISWEGWEDFITGGPDGADASTPPTVAVPPGDSILDYLGVPKIDGAEVNALPLIAYNKIWNEYYRDQDLGGEYGDLNTDIKYISWEKDYFTSARPWEQKGPDVTIPLGTSAEVISDGERIFFSDGSNNYGGGYSETEGITTTPELNNGPFLAFGDPTGLTADLTTATSVKVNELRRSFALQRYQEARAKYGSRYTEYLRFLGVKSSDSRLQRPEYLGGGKQTISVSEVLQTAPETQQGPTTEFGVGDMYGHGIAAMRSNRYRRFFEEHGYVISLASIRPKAMYLNGADRHFFKKDKEDYYQRELQHIGQQPIFNGEIYIDGTAEDLNTFGYQDRYIEYKKANSYVTGEFRSLLNYWHLARDFEERPVLNNNFVLCDPSKRIFNEQNQHSLWCAAQHRIVARRLVPRSNNSMVI